MTEKPVARHNAVGLLIDVVVLGATAVALFIALTGGSTYSIAGHVVRLQTPGNPFVVIAFLLVVRYVWFADVRFLLIGSAPRVAIDSLVRRLVVGEQPADHWLVAAARALFMAGRFFDGLEARSWLDTGTALQGAANCHQLAVELLRCCTQLGVLSKIQLRLNPFWL